MNITVSDFLTRHGMHPGQLSLRETEAAFRAEMDAALQGQPSSIYMLPSFIPAGVEPLRNTPVLVIDAGGSNLRAARVRFDENGRALTECLKKGKMPGTGGRELTADEMFAEIAAFAAEAAEGCAYACISFSYACDGLPDGDGRIIGLCKEVLVRGAEGRLVCRSLEDALLALGVSGTRKWRLINDSVGSLLGGLAAAQAGGRTYADSIGFILGTGTNLCCSVPTEKITKSPEAMAAGGVMIVNTEAGYFSRLHRGEADLLIDAASDIPGDHVAEKMLSGAYFPRILKETLLLAEKDGLLPPSALKETALDGAGVSALCAGEPCPLDSLFPEHMDLVREINLALLERSAKIVAAEFCAVLSGRSLPAGSTCAVCADGSFIQYNPILRPRVEEIMAGEAQRLNAAIEFIFTEDATLAGTARAGLMYREASHE